MAKMAPYDCEKLPYPKQIPGASAYEQITDATWDPWNNRWHDGRPSVCRYPDCVLIHKRYRDGRPPRQCPVLNHRPSYMKTCPKMEAQKEWRKQRREKRSMARLDRFLRDEERIRWPAPPAWNHEDYIRHGATAVYRDGKIVAYQWESRSSYSGFVDTVEDA